MIRIWVWGISFVSWAPGHVGAFSNSNMVFWGISIVINTVYWAPKPYSNY